MAKLENLDGPIGWLVDPHNKWAIHFDYKNVSNENLSTNFTIDMWGVVQDGKPMEFKSRRKATKKESIKIRNQLIEANWVEFDIEKYKTA